jgi:quercetin 2,3-dioxygenase
MGDPILGETRLGFQWPALDPFLFCVHHDDKYPAANEQMGPAASLAGRQLGSDFSSQGGWSMYHGTIVPGFPAHPHRGFETITIMRAGVIDHSDSLGMTARFGTGDVQWLTAGKGIVHAEMMPLLSREQPNPVELFQIWLNLPRASKMVDPFFTMLWRGDVPAVTARDAAGRETRVTLVAGALGDVKPPPAPPDSWASRPEADVAVWTMTMAPGATWTLPPAQPGTNRMLYVFGGAGVRVAGRDIAARVGVQLAADAAVALENGAAPSEMLLLQGRPIGEPVVAHGPFVMTSRSEVMQAFADYERTRFGGWPFASEAPVHAREATRFARRGDDVERPGE